jgi:glycine oxidase
MAKTRDLSTDKPRVAIVGAGVIGLGVAWRLAQRGAAVTVFERGTAGCGASWAAAGMLAVCAEAEPGEQALVALGRMSQARWPGFAAELQETSGLDVDLRQEGTLVLALTADDQARIGHHLALQQSLGLPVEWIPASEVRRREPHLAARLAGAVWSPQDHQVDNRKLAAALHRAVLAAGACVHEGRTVRRVVVEADRVGGIELEDGARFLADVVVLAAGAWSRTIEGIPPPLRPPVRPLKGQTVVLQMDPAAPLIRHVIRGPNAYMAPRLDGRLVNGATMEEKGFDAAVTAGGMLALLEAAWRLLPGIEELPVVETVVGHRPGSRDDAPILGPGPFAGLVYATGHHRNGILLTPVTADLVARLVLEGSVDPVMAPFGLGRFAPAHAAE